MIASKTAWGNLLIGIINTILGFVFTAPLNAFLGGLGVMYFAADVVLRKWGWK